MNTNWLGSTSDRLHTGLGALSAGAAGLGQPQRLRQIRLALCGLAVIWLAWTLSQVIWLLLPRPEVTPMPTSLVNPLVGSERAASRAAVNIEELAGWDLFGSPESDLPVVEVELEQPDVPAGIEDGARETGLSLKLQGLLASPQSEQARAIIEYQNLQKQYSVGDKLPLSGTVKLAKVLPDRVVLSNNGKYELLMLFDDNSLSTGLLQPAEPEQPEADKVSKKRHIDQRSSRDVTQMAESYRERLYNNPTSLAQAVRISAQRVDGQLQGYRVSPGRDKEQFDKLGFKPNDIVTGVNGIELTDPAKAMVLYKIMRSAEEASFEVMREGQEITLVVGLGTAAGSE